MRKRQRALCNDGQERIPPSNFLDACELLLYTQKHKLHGLGRVPFVLLWIVKIKPTIEN